MIERVPSSGDLGGSGGTGSLGALVLSSHSAVCEKAGSVIRLFVCTETGQNLEFWTGFFVVAGERERRQYHHQQTPKDWVKVFKHQSHL